MSNNSVRLALVNRWRILSAREPMNKIGVNRADDGLAALQFGRDGRFVLDEPTDLGCREVGIDL
jgi:hypothetical protein